MNRSRILLGAVLAFVLSTPVAAQESGNVVFAGNESGSETHFGGTVIVEEPVEGNLTVFAGNLFVRDEVEGDVTSFSGNTQVSSIIGGDLRSFSGNTIIDEPGTVEGSSEINSGSVIISGLLGDDNVINAGSISLTENGGIEGDLNYSSDQISLEGVVTGTVREIGSDIPELNALSLVFDGLRMIWRFLIGGVMLVLFGSFIKRVDTSFRERTLQSGVAGLVALIGIPIISFLLIITLVGIPVALVLLLGFGVILWLSGIIGFYSVGRYFTEAKWIALFLGVVIWYFLTLVPFVGGLLSFIVGLIGFGAFLLPVYDRYND